MSELQGEGSIIVYSDVCLRYRLGKCYCVVRCVSEVQGGINVIDYSDVCLRYRVGEMLFCSVMCV